MSDKTFEPRAAIIEKIRMLVAHKKKMHELSETPPSSPTLPLVGAPKIGRNDPCSCGSGKKYKKCCVLKGATNE